MLGEVFARDRLIMVGLVVLGLLTVIAGVGSGHSAIDYVLNRDAREAALSQAAKLDATLSAPTPFPSGSLTKDLQTVDGGKLRETFAGSDGRPATLPPDRGANEDGFTLLGGLDRVVLGWMARHNKRPVDEHVSKLDGFAVLDAGKTPLVLGGSLTPAALRDMLSRSDIAAALDTALATDAVALTSTAALDGTHRLAFVPMSQGGKVERVYAFTVDQAAAADMTSTALTVVTLTTSLLIVMGFSVPAAIAARRIRERWLAEDQIRFLALHDSLTGLPNRVQLRQHLERAAARSRRHDNSLAVLCLDLDRFKNVNDTLGHATGDALLVEVAARLRENVREIDLVGRLGGDEFAIVAEDIDSPEAAVRVARRVCEALGQTHRVNGHDVTTSASIGIALGPVQGEGAEVLMKNADLALCRAKQDGRNTFRFFEPAMDAALQKRRRLEHELRNALSKNQLYLDYQPQFDLGNGKLTGYEALVRWWHPSEGEVPPATFLPIAEETGLIAPLGEWILRTACAYATTWPADTTLAVNL